MKYPNPEEVERIREWFKDHRADLTRHGDHLQELKWSKPGTGIFSVTYLLIGGTLHVHGDIGSACYRWGGSSDRLSFEWLGGLSIDYFMSKCESSEHGREPSKFDPEVFNRELRLALVDGEIDIPRDWNDGRDFHAEDEQSAIEALREWFPDTDYETLGTLMSRGKVLDFRAAGHFYGLKMAAKQLRPAVAA